MSMTGLTETDARKYGFDPVSVIVKKNDKAGYMPNAKQIKSVLKLIIATIIKDKWSILETNEIIEYYIIVFVIEYHKAVNIYYFIYNKN